VSRRLLRLRNDLVRIESALAAVMLEEDSPAEDHRRRALAALHRFLLPRLGASMPLVVALVGSTGAGKSTLLNSLAGRSLSRTGVLRPTTDEVVVWTAPDNAASVAAIGTVVADQHPLAAALAVVDTPDLDSDLTSHRQVALAAAEASDAWVLVATPSRYGDAAPWEAIASLPPRPLAVVVNRTGGRNLGVRNDLSSILRRRVGGPAPVFTISEQRIDPEAERLPPQSVQRLSRLLREWASGEARMISFESVADQAAADIEEVSAALRRRQEEGDLLLAIARRRHLHQAREFLGSTTRRKWWRRPARVTESTVEQLLDYLDRAAAASREEAAGAGISLPAAKGVARAAEWLTAGDLLEEAQVLEVFERTAREWAGIRAELGATLDQAAVILAEAELADGTSR
jgi:energy-coupling factor transporter ATP-binding protein EcfA2